MKTSVEREFIRRGRRREWMLQNGSVALRPREYSARVSRLEGVKSMVFDIIDVPTRRVAGEIALRIGDGAAVFYLGHIGYHIDPPFRGRHMALQACQMCLPVFCALSMRSFVITTDEDNAPSVRTCERLGCVLESTVNVPEWCVREYNISLLKRRYVYGAEPLEASPAGTGRSF